MMYLKILRFMSAYFVSEHPHVSRCGFVNGTADEDARVECTLQNICQ